jgi:ribosomal protein L11 methyltransferase
VFAERFADDNVAVSLADSGGGRWQVALHFRSAPNEDAVRAAVGAAAGTKAAASLRFARVKATNWIAKSLADLAPVTVGRFVVHGAHDRARVASNRIGIEIEAALAFGTGHHGTTRACLLALDRIGKALSGRRRWNLRVLDLGTGSGVLAIAAARALHARVTATDIDAEAVRAARANARFNRAGAMVDIAQADGVTGALRARAPFDLVFANILLGPLLRLAAPLTRLAAPGARIVLSGITPAQANAVIAAYRPLALERRIALDGWITLVFVRHG